MSVVGSAPVEHPHRYIALVENHIPGAGFTKALRTDLDLMSIFFVINVG